MGSLLNCVRFSQIFVVSVFFSPLSELLGHVLRHAKKQRELFVWVLVHVRAKIQWEVLFYTPLPGTHVTQVHAKILLGSKN